jgi:vancomycin resistance protein YoaR
MNVALGKRTTARGFVPAPMISGGRLVNSVGGGISQVATALYNAAFFAGLKLEKHTPHSFYISRYPMGREATISWGGPELIFRNNWSSPVRMRLSTTADAVTVRMYSAAEGRRVQHWTGRPHNYVQPTTRVVHNPGLPYGSRRVVQEAGGPGFTIEYGRRVYSYGTLVSNDRFRVRYYAVDRIIEVGTR